MSHRGSILIVPSGVYAWPVTEAIGMTTDTLSRVLAESEDIDVLLMGTGAQLIRPSESLRQSFRAKNIVLDPMDTGAAARTYNVMRAEERCVAAALIAVG
ncbi:MAG: MTH938/NDUFAF3 family protein [Fimbriimonadaceae bacterium]|nr:MTH938/NDUFAF3 family protein [Alphaproteobacteria bacterium]